MEDFGERDYWIARHVLPHERALRRALTRWKLPDGLEVDDIVQEVFGRIAELADITTIQNMSAYMTGVARNIVLSHLRRARIVSIRAMDDVEHDMIPTDDVWVDEQVSDRQQLRLLSLAVDALEEPGRAIFLLRFREDLRQNEIARRLGISEDRVQRSLIATIGRLATVLGRGGKAARRASIGDRARKNGEN